MSADQQKRVLTSLINDEQRAVSYAWLARELGVTAPVSKSLLSEFVASSKQKLLVHYLISGDAKKSGSNSTATDSTTSARIVAVVPADKLSSAKESLETVISEHIYSVQRVAADSTPLSPLSAVSASVVAQVRALAGDPSARGQQVRSSFHGLIEPPSDLKISASRQSGVGDKGRPVASTNSFFGKPASTPATSTSDGIKKPSSTGGGINAFFGKAATNASVPTPSSASTPSSTTTTTAKKGAIDFFAAKKVPVPIKAPESAVKAASVSVSAMVMDDEGPSSTSSKVVDKAKSKRTIVIDEEEEEEGDAEFDHAAFEIERERQAAKKKVSGSGNGDTNNLQSKDSTNNNDDNDDDDGIFGNEEDEVEEKTVTEVSKPLSSSSTAEGAKKATSSSSPKGEAKPRKPKQPKTSKYASAQMDDEVVVAGSLSGKTTPAKKGSISKSLKKGGEGEGIGKDGRKVETLTFMNDDGYMVTEEVFVDEAAATALASVANADEGEASAVTGGLAVSVAGRMVEDDDDDDDSLIPRKPIISTKPATNIIDDDDDDDSLIPRKPSTLTSAKSPPKAAVTTKQSGLTTYFKKG
jgi:hypothetical protein